MQVKPKIFTLAEARAILPQVREITERMNGEIEEARGGLLLGAGAAEREEIERQIEAIVRVWADAVARCGAEPKGVGLVDFDSGDGYYWCWKYPEETLGHLHGYHEGYTGRRRIDGL